MKILHILNELRPSGAETMLRLAAPVWARMGYECEILATGQNVGSYAKALADSGYKIHHLPLQRSAAFFWRLQHFIKINGYEVVHQHAEGARYWSCLSALLAGAKVATTVHNNFQFDGLLRAQRALQRRHLEMMGVVFIAIAPGVRANEVSRFGIQPRLIWNWFDERRFQSIESSEREAARAHFGYSSGDRIIVTLGNCSTVKNHGAVLRAMVNVPDIRYLHVGEEDAAQSERALALELGVAERVRFEGWMPDPRMALSAADVFVMPSKYEGLGIAALEAIGSGLPCLLARSPGLVDLETLGLDLVYAEPDSVDIAAKLVAMFSELGALRKAARSNSAKVIARLAVDVGAGGYGNIYKELACPR